MIELFLIVLGLVAFVDVIFNKYDVWQKIEIVILRLAEKTKIRLFFELAFCVFCQRFWIGVLATITFSILLGFNWTHILVPFMVAGIYTKTLNQNK